MKSTIVPFVNERSGAQAASPGNFRQIYADFRTLDHALLDANLAAARLAFARLQRNSPALAEVVEAPSGDDESPRRASLRLLAQSLHRGAIKQAQQAFAQLQASAMTDTRDPFTRELTEVRPQTFWSAIDSES